VPVPEGAGQFRRGVRPGMACNFSLGWGAIVLAATLLGADRLVPNGDCLGIARVSDKICHLSREFWRYVPQVVDGDMNRPVGSVDLK
jgi:hypothetical protein